MKHLFIIVMPSGGYHQYHNLGVVNLVNQTMLVANLPSPLACSVSGELPSGVKFAWLFHTPF